MATESNDGSTAGLDAARLTPWFEHHVASAVAPFDCTLIAGGHSNLTYRIRDAVGTSRALRRPPTGPFPRGAHDVLREARIIGALADTPVRVPPVIATCDDDSIIGAPFYVMGWVDGQIVDRPALVEKHLATPELRERAAFELVDQIAHLHKLDVDAIGLGSLGRREDYLDRQLSRLRRVWDESKTRELPIIEQLHARLVERRPPQHHTGLVHADFRLGNVMLDAEGRALAVRVAGDAWQGPPRMVVTVDDGALKETRDIEFANDSEKFGALADRAVHGGHRGLVGEGGTPVVERVGGAVDDRHDQCPVAGHRPAAEGAAPLRTD